MVVVVSPPADGARTGSGRHEPDDNRVGMADEACFRVDSEAWLESLPSRNRQIAGFLTEGYGDVVARRVGLSAARVCQLRPAPEASWRAFQPHAEESGPTGWKRGGTTPSARSSAVRPFSTSVGRAKARGGGG